VVIGARREDKLLALCAVRKSPARHHELKKRRAPIGLWGFKESSRKYKKKREAPGGEISPAHQRDYRGLLPSHARAAAKTHKSYLQITSHLFSSFECTLKSHTWRYAAAQGKLIEVFSELEVGRIHLA
jgi:hypothetical protein